MINATIVKKTALTEHVTEFVIKPDETISYKAGQWVSLALPAGPTPPLKRAYSMATPQRPDGTLVLTFDHVPEGIGSGYLRTLDQDDVIIIGDCLGRFILPDEITPTTRFCFAGHFTGIVPIRGLIEQLHRDQRSCPIQAFYSAPEGEESVYYDDICGLLKPEDSIEQWTGDTDKDWLSEEWGKELTRRLLDYPHENTLYYIAGVGRFVRPLRALLKAEGVPRSQVKAQRYD